MVAVLSGDAVCQPGHGDELVRLRTLIAEDLVAEVAERSAFIRTQVHCLGEGGDLGAVKVPAAAGKRWMTSLLRAPAALRATDDATLGLFLKAAAFFQDDCTVKTLCGILGGRLLDAACSEQPSSNKTQHMTQVLEGLPVDVAIEVLRGAPGTFLRNFIHLPNSLKPIAALAEHPALAAACTLPVEGSEADPALPILTLCLDSSQGDASMPSTHFTESKFLFYTSSAEAMANAAIWLQHSLEKSPKDDDSSLFSLEQRAGTVACRLLARSTKLQDLTIDLPDNTCIVFGPGNMHLKNVTFQGGAVICMGSKRCVTFEGCVFERCGFGVLAGAHATLIKPQFHEMDASMHGLSVCVHGAGSCADIRGGSIVGGVQGVSVQAAARLEASDLTITMVSDIGVEVKDEVSSFTLTDCKVSESGQAAVHISGGATGCLDRCTLAGVKGGESGLHVRDPGSHADANHCHFLYNFHSGVFAFDHGSVNAVSCTSSRNGVGFSRPRPGCAGGYKVTEGGVIELTECSSDGDACGCVASFHGQLLANTVNVTRSELHGFHVEEGGQAMLRECSSTKCNGSGMYALHEGSQLDVEGCVVQQNGECGVDALQQALVVVIDCQSNGNSREGFLSSSGAQMTVSRSSSMADGGGGCGVDDRGRLSLVEVTVDDVSKSFDLP